MTSGLPSMLVLLCSLPQSREPGGSTRKLRLTPAITRARSYCCLLYQAVWLCLAVFGLCITSTKSFRADGTRLSPPPNETALANRTFLPFNFQKYYQQQSLLDKHSLKCVSTDKTSGAHWPRRSQHGSSGSSLAAVSNGRDMWAEGRGSHRKCFSGQLHGNSCHNVWKTQPHELVGRVLTIGRTLAAPTATGLFSIFSQESGTSAISHDCDGGSELTDKQHQQETEQLISLVSHCTKKKQQTDFKLFEVWGFKDKLRDTLSAVAKKTGVLQIESVIKRLSGKKPVANQLSPSSDSSLTAGRQKIHEPAKHAQPVRPFDGLGAPLSLEKSCTSKSASQPKGKLSVRTAARSVEPSKTPRCTEARNPSDVSRGVQNLSGITPKQEAASLRPRHGALLQPPDFAGCEPAKDSQEKSQTQAEENAHGASKKSLIMPQPECAGRPLSSASKFINPPGTLSAAPTTASASGQRPYSREAAAEPLLIAGSVTGAAAKLSRDTGKEPARVSQTEKVSEIAETPRKKTELHFLPGGQTIGGKSSTPMPAADKTAVAPPAPNAAYSGKLRGPLGAPGPPVQFVSPGTPPTLTPAEKYSKRVEERQRPQSAAEEDGQEHQDVDLAEAVTDQLLLALRNPPAAQQALALNALLVLVAAELSRRPPQTESCVVLAESPQLLSSGKATESECSNRNSPVDNLLHKGVLASLQRILSAPTPKPFWPRWLQREEGPSSKQALLLLQMQLDALQLLDFLSSWGSTAEARIARHKGLFSALERIVSLVEETPAEPSSALKETSSADAEPKEEAPLSKHRVNTFSVATAETDLADSAYPASETRKKETAASSRCHQVKQPPNLPSAHSSVQRSRQESQSAAEAPSPTSTENFLSSSSDAPPQPNVGFSFPKEGKRQPLKAVEEPQGNTENRQNTQNMQDQRRAQYPTALSACPSATGELSSDSRAVRASVERLAAALLARLGERAASGGGNITKESMMELRRDERSHASEAGAAGGRGWLQTFLSTFRVYREAATAELAEPAEVHGVQPGNTMASSPSAECSLTQSSTSFKNSLGSNKKCDLLVSKQNGQADVLKKSSNKSSGPVAAPAADIAVLKNAVQAFRTALLKSWHYLHKAAIFGSYHKGGSKTLGQTETKNEVFYIPLCLTAGDASVWAAVAAVAGEELAAAMKRKVAEGLIRPQQPAAGSQADGHPHLNGEFLALLQDAQIGVQPLSGVSAKWGVLVVAKAEKALTIEEDAAGKPEADVTRSSCPGGFSVVAGDFAVQKKHVHFKAVCLLTGQPSFQEVVQTPAIRALLDAAATGSQATQTYALLTLAELVRSEPLGSAKKISRELQSQTPAGELRLRALERGLAKAVVAPYTNRGWWGSTGSKADRLTLEGQQAAALDFLYALCTHDESVIKTLQQCESLGHALNQVIRFCTGRYVSLRDDSAGTLGNSNSTKDAGDANAAMRTAEEAKLLKVASRLSPAERHIRVLQELARPLRLATVISSALGNQPKWQPRVAGQRGLRILALDGGGTRGVLTVALLKHIAAAVGRELSEVFDIICGTSTGGIIAVLLGMEKASAAELEALYDALISEIFVKDSAAVAGARLVVRQAYYDESLWESLLQRAFGQTRMIDFAADVSIPKVFCLSTMVSTSPAKLVVWRNYNYPYSNSSATHRFIPWCFKPIARILHKNSKGALQLGGRYEGSCCVRVRDALRATTAAPGFFIGKKIGTELFVDGALLANNPAAVAIAEAKAMYPGVPIEAVVSIGTGQCYPERCDARTGWDGIFNQLVNAATNTESIHELLRDVLPESVYFRFNPEITAVSIDETSKERLDELKLVAKRFFEEPRNKEAIERLADILRPAYPLQKRSRALLRNSVTQTAAAGRWLHHAGNRFIRSVASSFEGPVTPSDSFLHRALKCCGVSAHLKDLHTTGSKPAVASFSENESKNESISALPSPTASPSAEIAQEAVRPSNSERLLVDAVNVLQQQIAAAEDVLNVDAKLVAGKRRSFLAWLLRSPRSTPAGSNGTFDTLELLGRRHLSSTRDDEDMETLVPLTGVRHVLHGIFQHITSHR